MVSPVCALLAQTPASSNKIEEMKLKLNEDGSHYLKWTFLNQVWLRYNDSNPGTTVLGEPATKRSISASVEHGSNSMVSSPITYSFTRSSVRTISTSSHRTPETENSGVLS